MAFTKRLIESVMQTAKSSTSGYQDEDELNRNIAMVENDLMDIICPLYEENQKVRDLLNPFITQPSTTVVTDNVVALPPDYVRIVDSMYKGRPVYKRNVNEISIIQTSPVRKPDVEKGPYYCYFMGGAMKVIPAISEIDLIYIRRPEPGEIRFIIEETDERDYIEIAVEREIEWPESAFNILYYLLLEKYGVEMSSQISMEYSQLGINKELSKV